MAAVSLDELTGNSSADVFGFVLGGTCRGPTLRGVASSPVGRPVVAAVTLRRTARGANPTSTKRLGRLPVNLVRQ